MKTTLFYICLVALAVLAAMAIVGEDIFSSLRAFAFYAAVATVVGMIIVAIFRTLYGKPEITSM